ncbi:DUF6249 domain-containing protein [Brevundimonas basaltis]|uniref:DUF6249 domain-containing protein n=1 Tax=Brevundimonas basaltis TaxID=472166 RepID=A0A7W8HY16_9CAUL|nr:DUF6249 domain-containing protein [Brevundimonas basaltis]MBB5291158.1 hypothetical protein [Brevundimonas basaltis]
MEDFIPVVAIVAFFGTIVAVFFGPTYLKSRDRRETQATVRHAIDKGQPLPPELVDAMTRDVASKLPSRTRDLRRGVIWLAVGIGFAAFSYLSSLGWNDHDVRGASAAMTGLAALPVTIGLAFILLSFFNPNKE